MRLLHLFVVGLLLILADSKQDVTSAEYDELLDELFEEDENDVSQSLSQAQMDEITGEELNEDDLSTHGSRQGMQNGFEGKSSKSRPDIKGPKEMKPSLKKSNTFNETEILDRVIGFQGHHYTAEELADVKIEIKDVAEQHEEDGGHEYFDDDFDDPSVDYDANDETRFQTTVTDTNLGEKLREDEDEAYLKTSEFVTDNDKDDQFVADDEYAITFDEAVQRDTIDADDDGSPQFLDEHQDFYVEDYVHDIEEDLDEEKELEKRRAWGGRRRRRRRRRSGGFFRKVGRALRRAASTVGNGLNRAVRHVGRAVRRTIRTIGKGIKRTVGHVGNFVKRTVRKVGKVLKKVVKTVHGVIKLIPFKEIGKLIGNFAKSLLDFGKCFAPGVDLFSKCVRQAIESVSSSCSGDNCHIKIGGKGSGCLALERDETVSRVYKPVTVSADISKHAGMEVTYYFQTGKIQIGFYGHVSVKPKVWVELSKNYNKKYEKRVELTRIPKTVFRKLIVITVGGAPVPMLLEVKVQPVVRFNLEGNADGSGYLSFELSEEAKIALDTLSVSYEPKSGARGDIKVSHSFKDIRVTKTLSLKGSASLTGTISVGPEITVSVNGVPVKMFPAVEFKAEGQVETAYLNGKTCAKGGMKFSTNLLALIIPDVRALTSVSANFGKACGAMVHFQCKYNPVVKGVNCFSKAFLNKDPCAEMNKGCEEFQKAMEVIPDAIQKNPIISKLYLLRRGLAEISWGNMNECEAGTTSTAVAETVGSKQCNGEDDCCSDSNKCGEGHGDCDSDSHCQAGLKCGKNNCKGSSFDKEDDCCYRPTFSLWPQRCTGQDNGCCTESSPCDEGEGDCDKDSHCLAGLKCGTNNCKGSTFDTGKDGDDCCYRPAPTPFSSLRCTGQDDGCCTESNPCEEGEGDCDKDSHCQAGLKCGSDNCKFGDDGDDCCYLPSIAIPGDCQLANWWHSFDKEGLSTCGDENKYMTGLYRNKRSAFDETDRLLLIEEAKCCDRSSHFGSMGTSCYTQSFNPEFDNENEWATCKEGYFMQGLERSSGERLHNIESAKCCKPTKISNSYYGSCVSQDVGGSFDEKGLSQCPSGYLLTGLYRGGCDNLYCLEKFKCCRMQI